MGEYIRRKNKRAEDHIGEIKRMNCGRLLTITEIVDRKYGNAVFIGKWDDGALSGQFTISTFNKGLIKYRKK